jgi:hypothetical protein
MSNLSPIDPAATYLQCAAQLGSCYCEHKGTGPCYRGALPSRELYSAALARSQWERSRARLALAFALAGLLLWPLGAVAMLLARPVNAPPSNVAYGIGAAELIWCGYIVASIIAHHV